MYKTGETLGEKTSKEEKVTATEQNKVLTMSTKNRLTTRIAASTPIPSHSCNPHRIPDRLMYKTGETIGEKTSKEEKVTATEQNKVLTMSTKNRLTTRIAASTPIPSHSCNPHRIPDRLMYKTGETIGEKTSKEEKVTATEQQKVLTHQPKIDLRHESQHLRPSQAIPAIPIEFWID